MSLQSKIQKEVEERWYKNNCKGTAALATGSGKSKIFVDIVSKQKKPWLLVVPTEKLRDKNWKEEFDKWNKSHIYDTYVTTCCYASLAKVDLSQYHGCCLDEGHNISINNVQPFKEHYERLNILVLTATVPRDELKRHILFTMLKCDIVYELSLKDAIKIGIVAPLKIYLHELYLSTDKNIRVKNKKTNFLQSEKGMYDYLCKRIEDKAFPTQMDYLIRARFIYNSSTKTEYAKKLLAKLPPDKRILIFSQSIMQIEEIIDEVYHSKTNDNYYNLFIDEKINRLGVVEALNEGENIKNLDIGFILQCNSNPKNLFQRIGRIVRKRKNHEAQIHILVLMNTVDEKWINNILIGYEDIITRIKV